MNEDWEKRGSSKFVKNDRKENARKQPTHAIGFVEPPQSIKSLFLLLIMPKAWVTEKLSASE